MVWRACSLAICAVAIGAAMPAVAADSLPPLRLADRAPAQVVAARSPVPADMTIPGGGGCNETVCLYTWTQTAIGTAPKDTYVIRTTLAGEPIDQVGQILGAGDGQIVSHFESQVLSLGNDFGVIWRGAGGRLRYRRVPSKGDVSWIDPTNLGPTVAASQGDGTNFVALRVDRGFVLMWITREGSRAFWNVQTFDADGGALSSGVRFAAPGRGRFYSAEEQAGVIVAIAYGEVDRPFLAAVSAAGELLRSNLLPAGPMGGSFGPAVLHRNGETFELVRAWHTGNQFTLRRLSVAGDGTFDAASETTIASTEERRPGWRVKLAMHGATGVLMWIHGSSSQDAASVFARRFDLTTGWIDGQALPVSGVVRSALEDADVFVTASHFVVVWNDPIRTYARTSCSWAIPVAGEAGAPDCRILSLNGGDPVHPELHVSERGYLIGWRHQEPGTSWSAFPRYLRHAPDGTRVDQTDFTLPDGATLPLEGGPNQLVFHSGYDYELGRARSVVVLNLQAPPFVGGQPLGDNGFSPFGVWTGERYLTVWSDNGNVAQMGGALAGRFISAKGIAEEPLPGFGTWRVGGPATNELPRIAIGTRGAQHLVVWMHDRPEGTLEETFNEFALLDRNGAVVQGGGFGELTGHSEPQTTACLGPTAVAGDSDGFLIACRTMKRGDRAIKFLGYQPGAPPWSIGMFAPTGMIDPTIRVWGDGIHLVWSRGQEIVQSLVRRDGRSVAIKTDQHVFPHPVADPRVASTGGGRAALIYRRDTDAGAALMFHLLDPEATTPMPVLTGAGADVGVGPLSPGTVGGGGFQCNMGQRGRHTLAPLFLFLLVAAVMWGRRIVRSRRALGRWTFVITLIVGPGCGGGVPREADAGPGGNPDGGTAAFDGPAPVDLPPPGPLPSFTPAPLPVPEVPQPVVRVDTSIDCDTGVAAQIKGGDRFATLQDALVSAVEGDTVQVCPGEHRGSFLITVGITLTAYSGDAGDTIVDGENKDRVLRVAIEKGTAPFRMRHLSLRRGLRQLSSTMTGDEVGGGMHIASVVPVEIDGCRLEGNAAMSGGGGIRLLARSTTTIRHSVFRDNKASYAGGALSILFSSNTARVVIEDCVFEKNASTYAGGALEFFHAKQPSAEALLTIVRSAFRDNTAAYSGGAISGGGHSGSRLAMHIEDSRFENNRAAHSGGAISTDAWGQTSMVIRNSVAAGNFAAVNGSAYFFGEDFSSWGDQPAIVIEGGRIVRNGAGGGDDAINVPHPVVIQLGGVDLGTAPDDNPGGDIHGCPVNYGKDTALTLGGSGPFFCQ